MKYLIVYMTAKDEREAEQISDTLLNEHLVACANIFPIRSLYWWKGRIEHENEIALIMKTQERHKESIVEKIKGLHSYEIPCIEFIEIESGNPDYLKWIVNETQGR